MIDNNINDKLRSGAYVRVLCEAGYKEALFGLSLSYRALTPLEINSHVISLRKMLCNFNVNA